MSAAVNKINESYIENLSHTYSNQLTPVRADRFIEAIQKTYGKESSKAAINWLLHKDNEKLYTGMKNFQERIFTAVAKNGKIGVDDQKYIADIALRFSNDQLGSVNRK